MIEWLGELVRQVDSSLLDEWEELIHPQAARPGTSRSSRRRRAASAQPEGVPDSRAQRDVPAGAAGRAGTLRRTGRTGCRGRLRRRPPGRTRSTHTSRSTTDIGTDADARSSAMLIIDEGRDVWRVRQIFADPAGDHDWGISATVDLDESAEAGMAVVRVTAVGMRNCARGADL